jgi:hypothetical protein
VETIEARGLCQPQRQTEVPLVKASGESAPHQHDQTDEMFWPPVIGSGFH